MQLLCTPVTKIFNHTTTGDCLHTGAQVLDPLKAGLGIDRLREFQQAAFRIALHPRY